MPKVPDDSQFADVKDPRRRLRLFMKAAIMESGLTEMQLVNEGHILLSTASRISNPDRTPDWIPSSDTFNAFLNSIDRLTHSRTPNEDALKWQVLHERARRRSGAAAYAYLQGEDVQLGAGSAAGRIGGDIIVELDDQPSPASVVEFQSRVKDEDDVDEARGYLEELEAEIERVSRSARRRLVTYRVFRFSVLVTSAVTPTLAILKAPALVTAATAAVILVVEGAIQLTRVNDRAVLDSQRVVKLSREFRLYRTQVDYYSELDTRVQFALLVKKIEAIREMNDNEGLAVVQQSFGSSSRPHRRGGGGTQGDE